MTLAPIEDENRRFDGLRSLKWRINLGILPSSSSSSSSSVDDLRRVTADSRRRYAGLRRRLLIDPQALKEGSRSADVVIDNPLSLNPDSTWGRFFRSAELEKMVDQDLSRLYPEHGSYFQTPGCQSMLRRILLLWCLRHVEYGYRQGMHELLAPLLYVLHVDVERLAQVRQQFEDHFMDKFDGQLFLEDDLTYDFKLKKSSDSPEEKVDSAELPSKDTSLDELDSEIQTIILLTDAYGAEGELGIIISEKFMEHDAYCMFDALMSGSNGSVAMAEFFSPSPASGSQSGLLPVIEASASVYHLLAFVDTSLHAHLSELGVEPQYFALRWLRVLFGREFSLGNLLIIWDDIFASENSKLNQRGESSFSLLCSPRGALISAMAVSMLLYLRSSLLATEHATSCLQRLLNFPEKIDLKKLLKKARSLQTLALETNISAPSSYNGAYKHSKSIISHSRSDSLDTAMPQTPLHQTSVSYWEEKWRVHHREEELRQGDPKKCSQARKKGWTEKVKMRLSRTESDPSPGKHSNGRQIPKSPVRRRLLEDLSRELGLDGDIESVGGDAIIDDNEETSEEAEDSIEDGFRNEITLTAEDTSLSGNPGSEGNSSIFSEPTSPRSGADGNENESEKSSGTSNISHNESDILTQSMSKESPFPISDSPEEITQTSGCKEHSAEKSAPETKERKPTTSGKFQWIWKFGRNAASEGNTSDKASNGVEASKSVNVESDPKSPRVSTVEECTNSTASVKGDTGADQNVMVTLKNLGHSMLDHIQVIESVFQQDRVAQVGQLENFSKNILVGKGQVTAIAALKELRKISNLLSEM